MNTKRESGREVSLAEDLRHILQVLRAKVLLITLCVVIAAALGAFYAWTAPKVYAAKSALQVDQEEQTVIKIEGVKAEDLKAPEILKTYEQNIVSPEVLLRVIHKHGLLDDPSFLAEVKGARSDNALQEALGRRITAKIRRDTRLIDVAVEDQSPALAQRIAELLVLDFIEWNSAARREAGQAASRFLHEQAERLNDRLAKSEQTLHEYKEIHGDVSLQDRQNISAEKLSQLSVRATEAKAERLKMESAGIQPGRPAGNTLVELLAIPGIATDPAVVDLKKKIGEKEAVLANLKQRYKAGYPGVTAARGELEKLRTQLDDAVFKAADVLDSHLRGVKLTEQKLELALRDQQKLALGVDAIGVGHSALVRDVESNRAMYEAVVTRMKETDITKELAQEAVRVVARPLLPDVPVKPKKSVVLGLSIIAGLGLGCFFAFVSHAADPSLKTLQDAESRLGLRLLSEIPRLKPPKGSKKNSPLLADSAFAALEAFRTLRTSLSLLGDEPGRKTILFTSAHAGEGKTFCAINCAVSFAQLGLNTLLIDADFRLPQIGSLVFDGHEMRSVKNSDGVNGEAEDPIRLSHIPNLSVLSSTRGGPNSTEFLAGDTFEEFIRRIGSRFDRIVVDSAPVHLVSDTLLFARHADSVCLVIHAGRTPAEDVLRAVQRLAEAGAPLVGFVWNQVKPGGDYGYYQRAGAYRGTTQLLS